METNTVVAELPPPISDQNSANPDFQFNAPEMDSLPIPPLDPQFFSDLAFDFGSGDNCEFDLTFDDLDDLEMNFLIPEDGFDPIQPAPPLDSSSPGSSAVVSIAGDHGGSDVSRFLNSPPPSNESATHNHDHDSSENSVGPISSVVTSPSNSGNSKDEITKNGLGKRKKEESDHHQAGHVDEEDKRKARLIRNRESAQLSRQRKKHYVEELEDKVRSMHSTISELNTRITYITAENAALKHHLSGGVGGGGAMFPPPPGMYPAIPYPWPSYSRYVVNPQGSNVVPIPRLKPKKWESKKKKSEGSRTKKVASISFLGLLFFILLFGGLVPMMNVSFGGLMDRGPGGPASAYFSDSSLYDEHRGRVLTVHGHLNGSGGKFDVSKRCGSDEFFRVGNTSSSEPLVASLYVPRNDGLARIDGNLIIHSVLASEKAKASDKDLVSALAIPRAGGNRGRHGPLYRNHYGPQNALTAGSADVSNDRVKSTAADGKLQQWFREGLAGPMLSSGMCTEVFKFDVSAAISPASSVSNVSEHHQNSTRLNMGRNRRILRVLPSSNHNVTEENVIRNRQNDNLASNRSVSSMVVSVLVDPREAVNTEVDGMIKPRSLSRIFVVVLLDSVKYVTYSCVLPRSGPHLVTT